MSIESIFISFIYPGQSPVRLGGSRCTLSKALGPSYFPSIRAGCIPRSRIHPRLWNLSKLVDLALAIFKCLFFNLLVHLMNWSLLKVLIPVFWPWQMKQPRPKGSLRQKNSRIFGHPCSLKFESLHLFALLWRRMRSLRTVFNDVQRVAHILSSVPAKCWFWLFLHFIVLWIPVVLEYIVFVCRCKLYLEWRFLTGSILHELVVAGWDTGGEASASLGQSTGWSERPWFSGQGRCSALKPEKQPGIKCRNCSPGKTCWTLPSNLQHAVLLRQLGAQDLFKVKNHQKTMTTQTNVATLTDSGMKFISLRSWTWNDAVVPTLRPGVCHFCEPGTKCVLCGPCAMPAKLSAAAAWAEAARFEASFCSSVVAAMVETKTANCRCREIRVVPLTPRA